jgi:hypothetical protein
MATAEHLRRELLVLEALEHLLKTAITLLSRERQDRQAQEWNEQGAISGLEAEIASLEGLRHRIAGERDQVEQELHAPPGRTEG